MNALIVKWGLKRPEEAVLTNFNSINKIILWKKDSGLTVQECFDNEKRLVDLVDLVDEIVIINYKKYCDYFGVPKSQVLYDYPIIYDSLKDGVKHLLSHKNDLAEEWQIIRADAAEIYSNIESRGILVSGKMVYPKYHMDVFSGRSRTTGFNIQGATSEYEISHPCESYNILIKFDWIAADMRIASYLSDDSDMIKSFEDGDPYNYVVNCLGGEIDRNQCKLSLNRAVNSLNDDDLILKIFPKFSSWIRNKKRDLKNNGFVESILGRKFYTNNDLKSDRRAFNSILQGSVVHAMQKSIFEVYKECGDIIISEQHDSLTVSVPENRLMKTISQIIKIMKNPFDGITMPLVVEVGRSWGSYKKFKEYR